MNRDNKNLPIFKLETEQGQSQIFLLGIKSSFLKKLEASGKLTNFKTNEAEKCISLLIIEFPMTIYFPSYLFLLVFLQLTDNFWPSSSDILLLGVLSLAIIQYHLIFRNMIYSNFSAYVHIFTYLSSLPFHSLQFFLSKFLFLLFAISFSLSLFFPLRFSFSLFLLLYYFKALMWARERHLTNSFLSQ